MGDGLLGLVPDREVIEQLENAGGRDKPRFGQLCFAVAGTDSLPPASPLFATLRQPHFEP